MKDACLYICIVYRLYIEFLRFRDWFAHSKPQRVLEESGDEVAIGMHLHTVPTRVGDHDRSHAFDDCIVVRRHVNAQQIMLASYCVVLVDPFLGPAIAYVVLSTRHNFLPAVDMDNNSS